MVYKTHIAFVMMTNSYVFDISEPAPLSKPHYRTFSARTNPKFHFVSFSIHSTCFMVSNLKLNISAKFLTSEALHYPTAFETRSKNSIFDISFDIFVSKSIFYSWLCLGCFLYDNYCLWMCLHLYHSWG